MSIDTLFTDFPILTTNRLVLRQIQLTDAEALFAIKSDPEVTEWYRQEPYRSLEQAQAHIQRTLAIYNQHEGILWGITLKGKDTVIGSGNFWNFDPDLQHAEIGYELNRAYWHQGFVVEAVEAILTFGFTVLGLHRIEAVVAPDNARSKNVLLKLGFTFEGSLRQRMFFRDHFEDEHYFGLLKDEWQGVGV